MTAPRPRSGTAAPGSSVGAAAPGSSVGAAAPGPKRTRGLRHPLVERVLYHFDRVHAWARRATRVGLALRSLLWLLGFTGLLLALPAGSRLGAVLPMAAVAALLPTVRPGGRLPTLFTLLVVGLAAARLTGDPPPAPLLLAVPLALLLYLHHSAAALAAQLRTDTVIPATVLRDWGTRTALVLGVSAPVGLAVIVLPAPAAWSATGFLALGTLAVVGVTALLYWLTRRPTP